MRRGIVILFGLSITDDDEPILISRRAFYLPSGSVKRTCALFTRPLRAHVRSCEREGSTKFQRVSPTSQSLEGVAGILHALDSFTCLAMAARRDPCLVGKGMGFVRRWPQGGRESQSAQKEDTHGTGPVSVDCCHAVSPVARVPASPCSSRTHLRHLRNVNGTSRCHEALS